MKEGSPVGGHSFVAGAQKNAPHHHDVGRSDIEPHL